MEVTCNYFAHSKQEKRLDYAERHDFIFVIGNMRIKSLILLEIAIYSATIAIFIAE